MEDISVEALRELIYTDYDGERVLDLSGRHLSQVPSALTNLTELERPFLSDNQLTKLPDNIGELGNLSEASVSNNKLAVLPKTFSQLKKLTWLYLENNKLTALVEDLGKCFHKFQRP